MTEIKDQKGFLIIKEIDSGVVQELFILKDKITTFRSRKEGHSWNLLIYWLNDNYSVYFDSEEELDKAISIIFNALKSDPFKKFKDQEPEQILV